MARPKKLTPAELLDKLERRKVESADELRRRLKRAQQAVAAKIEALAEQQAVATSKKARDQLYAQVTSIYEVTAAEIDAWMKDQVEKTAVEWHSQAVKDMRTLSGGKVLVSFSRDLVKRYWEMVHGGNAKYLAGVFTQQMAAADMRHLRAAFVDTFRQQSLDGWTARETQKALQSKWDRLAKNLRSDRFVDAAGRRWPNADYLNMLTRTTFAKVERESYVDTLVAEGNQLARIADDGDPCPICRAWSGVIVDISGNQKTHFPSLKQAYDAGWGHPNCSCRPEYLDPTLDKAEIDRQRKQPAADWKDPKAVQAYNDDIRIYGKRASGMTAAEADRDLKRDKLKRELLAGGFEGFEGAVDGIPAAVLDQMDRTGIPRIVQAKEGDTLNGSRDSSLGGVLHLDPKAGKDDFLGAFMGLQEKRGAYTPSLPASKPTLGPKPSAVPPMPNVVLTAKVRSIAKEIKNKPREVFALLDDNGKELHARHDSGMGGGDVPSDWKLPGNHIVHNHPSALQSGNNGFGASFSDADIKTAVKHRLASVTAVAGKRTYIMEPPEGGNWGTTGKKVGAAYEKHLKLSVAEVVPLVKAGRITKEQAILVAGHRAWKGVASEFGFKYTVLRGG